MSEDHVELMDFQDLLVTLVLMASKARQETLVIPAGLVNLALQDRRVFLVRMA